MDTPPPRTPARLARIALSLLGPAAGLAAAGGWWRALREVRANRYLRDGYDHVAAATIADTVLRSLLLASAGALGLALVAWIGVVLGRHLRGWSLIAWGVLGAWLTLVVSPSTNWRVRRVRADLELPNVLWTLREEVARVLAPPGAAARFEVFLERDLLFQPALCLAAAGLAWLLVGRRRPATPWPGPLAAGLGTLGLVAALLAGAYAFAQPRWLAPPAETTGRDVIYVTWDSTRADHLSCYGYDRDTTPELSRFAAKAVVYERAYSQHNWTRPSYMSIHTGRQGWEYVLRHGIDLAALTLAEALKQAGYRTRAYVQNPNLEYVFKFDQGFDRYVQVRETTRPAQVTEQVVRHLDELTADPAPFFLFVHFEQPHWPYEKDGVFRAPDAPTFTDDEVGRLLHEHRFDPAVWNLATPDGRARVQHLIDLYDSDLHETDAALGELLAALATRGRLNESLVIFNSDHGDEFLEHDNFGHAHANVHPELTHVPLILRFPDSLGVPARREPLPAANLDLFPTVLEVAGLAPLDHLPGRSLLSLTAEEARGRVLLSSEGGLVAARQGDRAFVRDYRFGRGPFRYDLARDPGELRPLPAAADLSGFAEIEALADWWGREIGSRNEGEGILPHDAPEELRQRLEDLGYF